MEINGAGCELAIDLKSAYFSNMKTQFLTNEKGKITAALIPIKQYEELMEDLEDLAACVERRDEETVPWEVIKKEFREDAALSH
jgi:hypothetical protein